jgi:hypothetical protein
MQEPWPYSRGQGNGIYFQVPRNYQEIQEFNHKLSAMRIAPHEKHELFIRYLWIFPYVRDGS